MRLLPILMALSGAVSLATFTWQPVDAARSPAMKFCSGQWADMKKANKVPEGEKWSEFWSQCSKDFAAKNGDEGTAEKAAPKASKANKPAATASAEDDSPRSAQQKKDCDAKWDANKTRTGSHGWHDYFQFLSRCM